MTDALCTETGCIRIASLCAAQHEAATSAASALRQFMRGRSTRQPPQQPPTNRDGRALDAHGLDRLTGADPRGAPACTILDTDIGTFADDTFALGFLLRLPAMALKLVVTASHDTVGRARVAAKHLTLAGADHIPIGVGIEDSMRRAHSSAGRPTTT